MDSGIASYVKEIQDRRITCEETTAGELSNIARYDKQLNAFTTVFDGDNGIAISRARKVDRAIRRGGRVGPLAGLPVTLKDNIFFGGVPTTAGSLLFRGFVPPVNADIVDSLLVGGCVPLGKTNLHEFALGATSTSAYNGPIANPHDRSRISGGSSGGSAVSVALSKGPIASIGTDTGGSVRVPAALCGVCGFKPSQRLLSTLGVFPLSTTLDHMGLLTKTMGDMSYLFTALTGIRRLKRSRILIGIPSRYFTEDMDEQVSRDFARAVSSLEKERGISVKKVELKEDFAKYSRARTTIMFKEASWFYEGILRSEGARSQMHDDVRSFMERGLKTGMIEYMYALNLRARSVAAVNELLLGVDAIIMPTCLTVAPRIDEVVGKETGRVRGALLRNTELFNTCGFPALSLPMGRGPLPTSVEIVSRFGDDALALAIGERVWNSLRG